VLDLPRGPDLADLIEVELSLGMRDPRFAERRYLFETQSDGGLTIENPAEFDGRFLTANAALDHWASVAPDRIWLAERSGGGWRRLSFAEAAQVVAALAGGLAGFGLGPGRPLMILARNSIDHALIAYAAMRLGAPIAPVSYQYGLPGADPARLAHAVGLIAPAAIYVDDAIATAEALESPGLRDLPVIATRSARRVGQTLATLLRARPIADQATPEQIAKLLLTSGSTGVPKAVVCTHRTIALNAAQVAACYADPDPAVAVHGAPWSHSLGGNAILHTLLHRGASLYIDGGEPAPDRFGETLRNLAEISPTQHNMVPAGWALLAPALEQDAGLARVFFDRLRILQYGGAGLAQDLCDRVQAVAMRTVGQTITFAAGYGATETGPVICTVHWKTDRAGLIGLPIPGTRIKLAPQGGRFELRVRGPQVSPGYFDARRGPAAVIAAASDADGYHRMGDAARLLDPARPRLGLTFEGRLVENFKLANGVFVSAGALRLSAVSAFGGAILDAIVCGEGQAGAGLLVFADPVVRARLGELALRARLGAGLTKLNAAGAFAGVRVARVLVLDGLPDQQSGELTDKGYINQALARARRPSEIARLFADPPDPDVIIAGCGDFSPEGSVAI
jgi:feruloyl-CoA synthase